MPAGDAGLERLEAMGEAFNTWFHGLCGDPPAGPDVSVAFRAGWRARSAEIDRLQTQLAAQQAVVDAARELWQVEPGVSVRSAWRDAHLRLGVALAALDKAQAAQPEGEPR